MKIGILFNDEIAALLMEAGAEDLRAAETKNREYAMRLVRRSIAVNIPSYTMAEMIVGGYTFSQIDDYIIGIEHPEQFEPEPVKMNKPIRELVPGCPDCENNSPVRHFGGEGCRSGSLASGRTRSHCSCDLCF